MSKAFRVQADAFIASGTGKPVSKGGAVIVVSSGPLLRGWCGRGRVALVAPFRDHAMTPSGPFLDLISWLIRHEQTRKALNLAAAGMWVGMWVENEHGPIRPVFA